MPTAEEILLTFMAKDNVSSTADSVGKSISSMGSTATSAMNNINSGVMQVSSASDSLISGLTGGKSVSDLIMGNTNKAETNKVLLNMMSDTQAQADKLYSHVDDITNNSLVSMQNLIPALNAFKTATGATDSEIYSATEGISNFGAKVLAQTGSTEKAETAMMDLSKGIKGACASLDQYGITTDALKRTGLWNGEEDDIDGYIAAVEELTGDTSELMQTNEGLDQVLGKKFSIAGKKIGESFLPQIKDAKRGLIELNDATGGNLFAGILAGAQALELTSSVLTPISQTVNGIRDLATGFKEAGSLAKDLYSKIKDIGKSSKALETAGDVADLGGDLTFEQVNAAKSHVNYGDGGGVDVDVDPDMFDKSDDMNKASNNTKKTNKAIDSFNDVAKKTPDIDAKGVSKVADGAGDVASAGAGLAGSASAASTASAGAGTFAGAFSGFGASLGAMLAPMLVVSAAVAVMIPVVVALAAEALIFIRGLMEVVKALDFGSCDLSGAISGLKQIASAMIQLGIAMAAVTAVSILSQINRVVSFFGLLGDPVKQAVTQLKKSAGYLKQFGSVHLDESVATNIKTIGSSLNAVSQAMLSLTGTTITKLVGDVVTLGGRFGTLSSNLATCKNDLMSAVTTLNEFTGIQGVNEGVASKLKALSEALGAVATAFGSMTDVSWDASVANILPIGDLVENLKTVKGDLIEAIPVVNSFASATPVDETAATNLKNIASALTSMGEAMTALSKLPSGLDTIASTIVEKLTGISSLDMAIAKIKEAATKISQLEGIPDVPTGTASKVTNVANALKPIKASFGVINTTEIPAWTNTQMLTNLRAAIPKIQTVSNILQQLSGLVTAPAGTASKVINIANAVKPVNTAITSLNNTTLPSWSNTQMLVNLRDAVAKIKTVVNILNQFSGISAPASATGIITQVKTAVNNLRNAVTSMNNGGFATVNTAGVMMAVQGVKNIITQLNSLSGMSLGGVGSLLTAVTTTLAQLKATLSASAGGFYASGAAIGTSIVNGVRGGLAGLSGVVTSAVSSAINTGVGLGSSGGARIAQAINSGFSGALNLADTMSTEMDYVVDAVNNGISAAKSAAQSGAEEVVQAFKDGVNTGSPGDIAWTMYDEMWYTHDFIVSEGKYVAKAAKIVGQNVVKSFGNPSLGVQSGLDAFNSDYVVSQSGTIDTMLSTAPSRQDNRPVVLNIHEGAVKLDARNLTTKESKQVMINALEGMDCISNVNIRGFNTVGG